MKNTELRIGNYVRYNDEIIKVEQITKRKIGYHRNGDKSRMHYLKYSEIKPIEITEDLLLKNGFEDDKYGIFKKLPALAYSGDNVIIFHKIKEITFHKIKEYWIVGFHCGGNHLNKNIKHIHELQNTYYVCNEKELELKF